MADKCSRQGSPFTHTSEMETREPNVTNKFPPQDF